MNSMKPGYPGNFSQFFFICPTFSFTSENAIPKNEFNYLNTKQNWSKTSQNSSNGTYPCYFTDAFTTSRHLIV